MRALCLLILALVLPRMGACAENHLPPNQIQTSDAIELVDAELGIDGRAKVGVFVPLRITLRANVKPTQAVQLRVTALDPEGADCSWEDDIPLDLSTDTTQSRILGFKIGRLESAVTLEARSGSQPIGRWTFPAGSWNELGRGTQEWVVVLGSDIGMSLASRFRNQEPARKLILSQLMNPEMLPRQALWLEGVDAIVLTTGDADWLATISAETWSLLQEYVRMGGRLIVSCGHNGTQLLGEGGALRPLVPSTFLRVRRQLDTTGLEGFAGTIDRLDLVTPPEGGKRELEAVQWAHVRGRSDAFDGAGDQRVVWIVRNRLGFGCVTVLATDLDRFPVAAWEARPRLLARLLDLTLGSAPDDLQDEENQSRELSQLGYHDLAGQLRVALDNFRGVGAIPFSTVLAVAALGVLVISAGDLALVRYLVRRPMATWITLPLLAGLISWGMIQVARAGKGDRIASSQLEIIDLDLESGRLRGNVWTRYFAPTPNRFDFAIDVATDKLGKEGRISWSGCAWQGVPGNGTGGMDSTTRAASFSEPYQIVWKHEATGSLHANIQQVSFSQWSSRGFQGNWQGGIEPATIPSLESGTAATLTGTLVNPLPIKMRDCTLYYARWAYELGNLEPAGEIRLERDDIPKEIVSKLTRRRFVDIQEITSPWIKEGTDIPRIAEMLMFHEASGGEAYTDLMHRYFHSLDASDVLHMETAVLVGRIDTPITTWLRNGKPTERVESESNRWSFVRIFLPVTGSESHE